MRVVFLIFFLLFAVEPALAKPVTLLASEDAADAYPDTLASRRSSGGESRGLTGFEHKHERFAVYYSDKAPVEAFRGYDLLVLDSQYYPPLEPLKASGKQLLGYLSLGEVEERSPYLARLRKEGMALNENEHWQGSYTIDIRRELWQEIVTGEIIPGLIALGFDGVFFDTLDSPLDLERNRPDAYRGMNEAAVKLVRAIRQKFPDLKIMVNRAYDILPAIAHDIDMALGECVAGDYDFEKKRYYRVKAQDYRRQVQWLQNAREINPKLKIYTLDYANPKDKTTIAEYYRLQRANGFIPYVATVQLHTLIDEPASVP